MNKYVAFLRGVNVGGRIIKMAELKACFEKAGYKDVKTLLQTGNAIFESDKKEPALKAEIEQLLTKTFNYPAIVQVVKLSRLRKLIEGYPFGAAGPKQHNYIIFMENGLEKTALEDTYELGAGEKVQAGEGVIYWRVDQGQTLRSSFGKLLSKTKYKNFNTIRNINTLNKILTA
jgi:uncharacterized protein (DUF1697 family)